HPVSTPGNLVARWTRSRSSLQRRGASTTAVPNIAGPEAFPVSDLSEPLLRVAEAAQPHARFVQKRQVQAAHLPVPLLPVVQHPSRLDLPATPSHQHHA